MLAALALGLTLLAAPASPGRAIVELGPADAREVEVVDGQGNVVATATVRDETATRLELPAGEYEVRGEGMPAKKVTAAPGERTRVALPGDREPSSRPTGADGETPPLLPDSLKRPRPPRGNEDDLLPPSRRRRKGKWKRWGSPLLSALIPGLGQVVNRQPGKGLAIFASTVGLAVGTYGVVRSGERQDGATAGEGGEPRGSEIVRLGALSALSSGLGLLYLGQIMDAHAVAVGKRARPRKDHAVAVELYRFSTVGLRPGEPAYALYDDFTLTVMGQIAPRVSIGVSDLTVHTARGGDQLTFQGGLRTMYRFFDRKRVWLSGGGGFIFQGTSADAFDEELDPDAPDPGLQRRFGAVVYGQLGLRWFILDRWSLGITPRVSLPLTHRDYGRRRRIPRFATTFELGTGLAVYF